jgi:hypothetical protein
MKTQLRFMIAASTLLLVQAGLASTLNPLPVESQARHGQFGSQRTGESVLLVQVGDGWGLDLVAELTALGASVTSIAPADLAGAPLTPYCLVVLDFQSAGSADANIAAANAGAANVEAYVAGGGTLMFSGGQQNFDTPLLLPGGVFAELNGTSYSGSNPFVDAGHPILAGLSDPIVGNFANHEVLYGLPGGVILNNANGDPCAAEYAHGAGTVVAITAPAGAYYPNFDGPWGLWLNTAAYSLSICNGGGVVDAREQASSFELGAAYPNPFNPSTTIAFRLDETAAVELAVWNLAGERVATLVEGLVERGAHEVVFDASRLSSGVYISTLRSGARLESSKLVLVK